MNSEKVIWSQMIKEAATIITLLIQCGLLGKDKKNNRGITYYEELGRHIEYFYACIEYLSDMGKPIPCFKDRTEMINKKTKISKMRSLRKAIREEKTHESE